MPIVLITGCSGGIGAALAREFAAQNAQVIATARRLDSLNILNNIKNINLFELDVTKPESIKNCIENIQNEFGKLDMLINNAGIPIMGPTAEIPLDELRQQWEVNLTAPMAMVQASLGLLENSKNPKIVNIGSVSGILTTPFAGPYCASKAALHCLNDALRMELAPFGMQVILVQPGGIQSNFGANATKQTQSHTWRKYAKFAANIQARAEASQQHSTPTEVFAEKLVKKLLLKKPDPIIRLGAGSDLLPKIAALPIAVKDKILRKKFGL